LPNFLSRFSALGQFEFEKHIASIAIHYMHYNFCRVHETLRVTPAIESGIADHVWSIEEMIALLDKTHAVDSSAAA
jgi:hypothetical protein